MASLLDDRPMEDPDTHDLATRPSAQLLGKRCRRLTLLDEWYGMRGGGHLRDGIHGGIFCNLAASKFI